MLPGRPATPGDNRGPPTPRATCIRPDGYGEGAVVARLTLSSSAGEGKAVYEPDLRFPPEWNRRTVLLRDIADEIPDRIDSITISLWAPSEVGAEFEVLFRRCELLGPVEVAAELVPVPCTRKTVGP